MSKRLLPSFGRLPKNLALTMPVQNTLIKDTLALEEPSKLKKRFWKDEKASHLFGKIGVRGFASFIHRSIDGMHTS